MPPSKREPRKWEVRLGSLIFWGATSGLLGWLLLEQLGVTRLIPGVRGRETTVGLIVAGAGAVLGLTRANRLWHALTALIVALWVTVSYSPLAGRLARPLEVAQPPAPADAVVVLASWVQPDDDFTDQALARLTRGLQLTQSGFAPRLLLTEVAGNAGSHTEAAKALAQGLAIPCPVETLGKVRDTHDEAVLVSRLAREREWKRVLLVTSATHSKRALLTLRKAGSAAGLQVISVPAPETQFDLEGLHDPDDRRRAFARALYEIAGLWIYRLRGWA